MLSLHKKKSLEMGSHINGMLLQQLILTFQPTLYNVV